MLATVCEHLDGKSLPLGSEHEGHPHGVELAERSAAARDQRNPRPRRLLEGARRDAEDRPRRGPQRLRPGPIGATLGERDKRRPERIRRAEQRAHVSGVGDAPEREPRLGSRANGEIRSPVDTDHPRRMRERRDLREQLRLHRLPCHQEFHRLHARRPRRLDEILALRDEEAELVAPATVGELPDELELLVLPRPDQVSSAAFACAAIAPKAAGSFTARSASTFRSSAMSAFRRPATNWLYESPFARAAALIRTIQSRRKVRLRFFRSRYA